MCHLEHFSIISTQMLRKMFIHVFYAVEVCQIYILFYHLLIRISTAVLLYQMDESNVLDISYIISFNHCECMLV